MITLDWGAVSETGHVRAHNEDSFVAEPPVFAIADGMGGHLAGDVASSMTIATLQGLVGRELLTAADVEATIRSANETVMNRGLSTRSMWGMGTTLVGLALLGDGEDQEWLCFNVGDSRLYRFAENRLVQISRDHSEVQELLDRGSISIDEAHTSAARNVLTRAVGTDELLEVDYWRRPPEPGERFLVCSDGLTGELSDDEIASVLGEDESSEDAAGELVDRALAAGGRDNVTVIVLDVLD